MEHEKWPNRTGTKNLPGMPLTHKPMLAILKLQFVRVLGDSTWIKPRGPSSPFLWFIMVVISIVIFQVEKSVEELWSCILHLVGPHCTWSLLVPEYLALRKHSSSWYTVLTQKWHT